MAEALPRPASRGDLRLALGFGLFFLAFGLFGAVVSWGSYRLEVRIQPPRALLVIAGIRGLRGRAPEGPAP